MILAIDANTSSTGFAFGGVNDGAPKGGVLTFPGAGDHLPETLAQACRSVAGVIQMCGATLCAVEAPLDRIDWKHSRASLMALVQLTGAIRAGIRMANCKEQLLSVDEVRRNFIGSGRMSSNDAEIATKNRCDMLGWDYAGSHDRADANAVWYLAMVLRYPQWRPSTRKF